MKNKIVQVKNPKTGRYVRINREKAIITGHKRTAGPYKNIIIIRPNPRSDYGKFAKWLKDNPKALSKAIKKSHPQITNGSGNVFKDMGCSFPTLRLIRSNIKSFLERVKERK